MSGDETMTGPVDRKKGELVRIIIATGWGLSLLTMVGIIFISLYLIGFKDYTDLPDVLKQWGSLALGFLFGSFPSIVKEYMND